MRRYKNHALISIVTFNSSFGFGCLRSICLDQIKGLTTTAIRISSVHLVYTNYYFTISFYVLFESTITKYFGSANRYVWIDDDFA